MATLGATIIASGARGQTQSGLEWAKSGNPPQALKLGAPLDCSIPLPNGWIVTPDDTAIGNFAPAEIFVDLTRRHICYDPTNRNRCEIELFAARIVPDRVGLAAHYAQILAREWGPKNHGTAAHNSLFGEVLTGGDWSGHPALSRISVWRRGEWLLIQRARYQTDYAAEYQPVVAGMVSGMNFDGPEADPITKALRPDVLELDEGTISTLRPEWWRDPGFATPPRDKGQFKFWVDEADALRNSGAMIATQRVEPLPDNMTTPPTEVMAEQADSMLELFLTNLLPGQNIACKPTSAFTLGRTDHGVFDKTQVFRLDFTENGLVGLAQVTQVLTRDGRLVASVKMTRAPLTLDTVAPHLHATWFENQINTAVAEFLTTRRAL